jgi:hypothetical protein
MWQCTKCGENLEDSFDLCWNCGTSRDGTEDPNFRKADDVVPETELKLTAKEVEVIGERGERSPMLCPRCDQPLGFVGTKKFHEGFRWGILGDLAELLENREWFDVYCCPRCGRVEFFVTGIGEQFRPHSSNRESTDEPPRRPGD